jgi:hypothetical protein
VLGAVSNSGDNVNNVMNQIQGAVADAADQTVNFETGFIGGRGLGTDTHSVQVSVGGNDLGFGSDLACAVVGGTLADNTVRTTNQLTGQFCIPDSSTMQNLAAGIVGNIEGVYRAIASAAPDAVIEPADEHPLPGI